MSPPNVTGTGGMNISPPEHRPAKRRRGIHVCDLCRLKKNRCDGQRPVCGACQKRQVECIYAGQKSHASIAQEYIESLKARNYLLEQQLAAQSGNRHGLLFNPFVGDNAVPSPEKASVSTTNPSHNDARFPATNGFTSLLDPPSQNNAVSELHVQNESHLATNLGLEDDQRSHPSNLPSNCDTNEGSGEMRVMGTTNPNQPAISDAAKSSEYFGESSTFDFMSKVCSPGDGTSRESRATASQHILGSATDSLAISSPSAPIFDGYLGIGNDDLFCLPNRFIADRLVDAYFKFTHPLNTYLHEWTFRERYERLWLRDELGGEEATESNLAWFGLVNLVFAFGSNYTQAVGRISIDTSRFFKRAKALAFSGLFQSASIELVQALLLIGQYLHSSLELDNSWTVVGLAIRMAQTLGLHLETDSSRMKVIDQEVRKRIWWGCFVIDRLLSMKVGRPPIIHDSLDITVGLPLPIDDEYLTNDTDTVPLQPPGTPSRFDFLTYAISQCRLLERICKTIYGRSQVGSTNISKLLALSIELDGELVAWQQSLPPHLQFDSQIPDWHFARQRSTLLIRFLNCRLLLHRQILLIYITRQCPDSFQRQIIYPCIQRCIISARDTINQVSLLSQKGLLHSWWHNTHSVFTALCVMLAFRMLDTEKREQADLLDLVDVDKIISKGSDLLRKVGEQSHPLASRYLHWFQKLEKKLPSLSLPRPRDLELDPITVDAASRIKQVRSEDGHYIHSGFMNDVFHNDDRFAGEDLVVSNEELLEIENMFFSAGWGGTMEG